MEDTHGVPRPEQTSGNVLILIIMEDTHGDLSIENKYASQANES